MCKRGRVVPAGLEVLVRALFTLLRRVLVSDLELSDVLEELESESMTCGLQRWQEVGINGRWDEGCEAGRLCDRVVRRGIMGRGAPAELESRV